MRGPFCQVKAQQSNPKPTMRLTVECFRWGLSWQVNGFQDREGKFGQVPAKPQAVFLLHSNWFPFSLPQRVSPAVHVLHGPTRFLSENPHLPCSIKPPSRLSSHRHQDQRQRAQDLVCTLNTFLERFCFCVLGSNSLLNGIRYNEIVRCCSCSGDVC